jgi:5-methylcytosine-specific restriction endonuclease McrA
MIVSKKRVLARYGSKCAYCGRKLTIRTLRRDHVEPLCRYRNVRWTFSGRYGCKHPERHNLDNIVPACQQCNDSKSSLDLETWRASLKWPPLGKPVVFYFEKQAPCQKKP